MPIGDLLAQIGGEPSTPPASKPSLLRVHTVPKRKAGEDIRSDAPKTPRTLDPTSKPSQASRPLDKSSSTTSANAKLATKTGLLSSKPMNEANKVTKPQPSPRPNAPAANGASATPVAKAAPKKGSYAEILARAKNAQAAMGQVGRIQHKKVEGGIIKKEKEKEKEAKGIQRSTPGKRAPAYAGSSAPKSTGPSRNGSSSSSARPRPDSSTGRPRPDRPEPSARPKGISAKEQAQIDREHERKMKKLSQSSSYSGTSRGKPPSSSAAKRPSNKPMPRGGALLNTPKPRPANRSRYDGDDYDEDMDDFIDYDDEEDDQGGPRYEYASDASSDMEAGLDDIDGEERRAERIARLEDLEEQRMEEKLKMAKEERKRRALEELRHKRR